MDILGYLDVTLLMGAPELGTIIKNGQNKALPGCEIRLGVQSENVLRIQDYIFLADKQIFCICSLNVASELVVTSRSRTCFLMSMILPLGLV